MNKAAELLKTVRTQKPLVHHITNQVTMSECANITLNLGALPVMAHAREEVSDMVKIASSLVLNIGTLTLEQIETMLIAGKTANQLHKPIILDVVGAGATPLRTESSQKLLKSIYIDILKGNLGEISSIAGVQAEVRGVESIRSAGHPAEITKNLAQRLKNIVVITGAIDYVSDGQHVCQIKNGHAFMSSIVGTGCMCASVIGAFAGVTKNYCEAAQAALISFGIIGEMAAHRSKGPGNFRTEFFNAAYAIKPEDVLEKSKIIKL